MHVRSLREHCAGFEEGGRGRGGHALAEEQYALKSVQTVAEKHEEIRPTLFHEPDNIKS